MLPVYSNGIGSDVNPRCPARSTFCCTGMTILHCLVYAAIVAITMGVYMSTSINMGGGEGGRRGGREINDRIE